MVKNLFAHRVVAGALVFAVQGLGCSDGPPAPTPIGVPVVTSISPTTGSASGGTPVTINGSGFQVGATMMLSGTATDATVVNDHVMTAVMPEHPGGGAVEVTVTNPNGKSGSLRNKYLYIAPPTIASISGSPASTDGGASFTITGSGLQSGNTVMFGTVPVQGFVYQGILYGTTPPHAAGTVDLLVTNSVGGTTTLAGGYVFVPRASLDFNGDWVGGAGNEGEVPLQFSIRDNRLVALACGGVSLPVLPTPVVDGQFSLTSESGTIAGRIISADQAIGTLDVPACHAPSSWWVSKK